MAHIEDLPIDDSQLPATGEAAVVRWDPETARAIAESGEPEVDQPSGKLDVSSSPPAEQPDAAAEAVPTEPSPDPDGIALPYGSLTGNTDEAVTSFDDGHAAKIDPEPTAHAPGMPESAKDVPPEKGTISQTQAIEVTDAADPREAVPSRSLEVIATGEAIGRKAMTTEILTGVQDELSEDPELEAVATTDTADKETPEDPVAVKESDAQRKSPKEVSGKAVHKMVEAMRQSEQLTREKEVEIGEAMQAGEKARETLDDEDLFANEPAARNIEHDDLVWALQQEVAVGLKARERLIVASLGETTRHVERLAFQLPERDRYRAAYYGLVQAADHFDHQLGYRFSTYAKVWIRREIFLELYEQGMEFRLPRDIGEGIVNLRAHRSEFTNLYGHEPETDDLAQLMGVNVSKAEELIAIDEFLRSVISLQMEIKDGGSELSDVVPPLESFPEDEIISQIMRPIIRETIMGATEQLPENQREVFLLSSGLYDERPPMTTDEIAELNGKTVGAIQKSLREARARLVKDPALRLLREDLNS